MELRDWDVYDAEEEIMHLFNACAPENVVPKISRDIGLRVEVKKPYVNAANSLASIDGRGVPYVRIHPEHENMLVVCHEVAHAVCHAASYMEAHTIRWMHIYRDILNMYTPPKLMGRFYSTMRKIGVEFQPETILGDVVERAKRMTGEDLTPYLPGGTLVAHRE